MRDQLHSVRGFKVDSKASLMRVKVNTVKINSESISAAFNMNGCVRSDNRNIRSAGRRVPLEQGQDCEHAFFSRESPELEMGNRGPVSFHPLGEGMA